VKAPKPPDNMLSDEDVAIFWGALNHWQEKLGLQDWRITHSMLPKPGALACMDKWDWPQKQVRCRLSRNWKAEKVSVESLAATALHELLHVLLHPLIESAKDPRTLAEDLQASEHAVINKLERLLGDI